MSNAGSTSHDVMFSTILSYFQQIHAQNSAIAANNALIVQRLSALESQISLLAPPGDAPTPASNDNWVCPVCFEPLLHAKSFKGHIRRLVVPSSRPKCRMNPSDIRHQVLLQRFEGDSFDARSVEFCRTFYGFVRCVISASYEPSESLSLVQRWLMAAKSPGSAFPECPNKNSDGSGSGTSGGNS
jgi:hypothetical protein